MNNDVELPRQEASPLSEEGYRRAVALMHECATEHGFLATPTKHDNYRRVWARDSAIIGLAALLSEEVELIDVCRRSSGNTCALPGPAW